MGQIRVLDEHIANQIAAGEVVERPASVVKELVENAIDARSTRIDVHIGEGGLESIRVQDNGQGIAADDCETAFYRHATSKLADDRDLYQITSLGFRGEALPSIAAVSKVDLLTSATDDGAGRRLIIEGGTLKSNEDDAAPRGTDFRVNSLFYNTPARLKYMKTVQTELGHISDIMYRMSLAHPEIAFTLRHNGNLLLQTPGNGDMLQVIAAVYGTSAAKMVLPIEQDHLDYHISGYIGRPEIARANRNAMSVIVNGRYIKSYTVNQAILRAYHTLLPINRYPLTVLRLTMHPSLVDVNVHPAKMEVRFSKEAELMMFVEESVRQTLRREILIPHATKQTIKRGSSESIIQEQFNFNRTSAGQSDNEPAAEFQQAGATLFAPRGPEPVIQTELGDLDAPYVPPLTDQDIPGTEWQSSPDRSVASYQSQPVGKNANMEQPEHATATSDSLQSASASQADSQTSEKTASPAKQDVNVPAEGEQQASNRQITDSTEHSQQANASTVNRTPNSGDTDKQPVAKYGLDSTETIPADLPGHVGSGSSAGQSAPASLDAPAHTQPPYTAAQQVREPSYAREYNRAASKAASRPPQRVSGANRSIPAEMIYGTAEEPGLPQFPEMNLIGQHHGTYLIAQNAEGLFLIDQHAAHERVNYEYYYEKFGQPESASQELLLPITLEFTRAEADKLKDRLHWFERVGVYLEHFGGQTFRVRAYPYWFPKGEEARVIEEMAEWVLSERKIDLAQLREQASTLCSCKASIKANQRITEAEAQALLDRLAACRQPYTCPHGRPIVVSFSSYDLEKMFKRVM
ncbi:DNA mismatch repair endonuclease MutL [Paenibacillus bovis]|uniref:DNA mismatch repair protein MutL n=1 Tax=Paenibacillus bovis TaxID=1616788 RepID=A0A172ZI26_9BACL|nr:DNA mismatch repair endonuclease MutL [Paenibacillus bovis]ANF97238.1 DNA mismatch repair protein MutL [Paenibacillus bovis]